MTGIDNARRDMKRVDALMAVSRLKGNMAYELNRLGGVERCLASGHANIEELIPMVERVSKVINNEVEALIRKMRELNETK